MNDVSIAELAPLSAFERVVVFTGAGISTASGLPTYRTEGGTWTDADARRASMVDAIDDDLAAVWRLWGGLAHRAASAEPNAGHDALARAERSIRSRGGDLTVVTQNVDGLHQGAGQDTVVEMHGSARRQRCLDLGCGRRSEFAGDGTSIPTCSDCDGRTRPDIVLFGESLNENVLRTAWRSASECDLLLAVGTSCSVSPASDVVVVARRAGALCVSLTKDPLPTNPGFNATLTGLAERELPRWAAA